VKPQNKGHFGTKLCREVVLFWRLLCTELEYNGIFGVLLSSFRVSFIGGFTVYATLGDLQALAQPERHNLPGDFVARYEFYDL